MKKLRLLFDFQTWRYWSLTVTIGSSDGFTNFYSTNLQNILTKFSFLCFSRRYNFLLKPKCTKKMLLYHFILTKRHFAELSDSWKQEWYIRSFGVWSDEHELVICHEFSYSTVYLCIAKIEWRVERRKKKSELELARQYLRSARWFIPTLP